MWRRGDKRASRDSCNEEEIEKILFDPSRLLIVAVLTEGCVRFIELQKLLNMSKGRLYFHLKVLERACVIKRSYRLGDSGPALYLCLTSYARHRLPEILSSLISRLEALRRKIEGQEESSGGDR